MDIKFIGTAILTQNIDDMEADLFAPEKKPSEAPAQTKAHGNEGPKKDSSFFKSNANPEGAGNSVHGVLA